LAARYQISFTPRARRDLSSLPKEVQRRLDVRILALSENPRPPGSKKLSGEEDLYRIRLGDYRVIYGVYEEQLLVLVIKVGPRRDVYRSLRSIHRKPDSVE
jgi:mRNA interferase RelE/StbE